VIERKQNTTRKRGRGVGTEKEERILGPDLFFSQLEVGITFPATIHSGSTYIYKILAPVHRSTLM
jgi:hypothetical protein